MNIRTMHQGGKEASTTMKIEQPLADDQANYIADHQKPRKKRVIVSTFGMAHH